jgi:4-hydroxy-3-methylbut-2-en-1-yl diphosphate reductase
MDSQDLSADLRPRLDILLAAPRGFCAGVDRAIQIVEQALERFGAPVYVRHEIVHNRFVVDSLAAKGAIFVEELDEVPDGAAVIFSAHGVPKAVPVEAARRGLRGIDATCPLVSKVHREAERHHKAGRLVLLIGHAGHPEVVGTMGQLPPGATLLIEHCEDVSRLDVSPDTPLAYATQTTLSVDDTGAIVAALKSRFPGIVGPKREDICYATTNRQAAVRAIAPRVEALFVVGAENSSNSRRLVEVAQASGCKRAKLISRAAQIDWGEFRQIRTLGLTAGASAPEILVEEVIAAARRHYAVSVEEVAVAVENIAFNLPRALAS